MTLTLGQFPWQHPPWHGGTAKYRLGLRPISIEHWFQGAPSAELRVHKFGLLRRDYPQAVQAVEGSETAQRLLAEKMQKHRWFCPDLGARDSFPDLLAALSLQVADDLCLMESSGEQRLVAASVCSPSYWNVLEKIGLPMSAIHEPVVTLQGKIGQQIQRFIRQAPLMTPFERSNWFVHGDQKRQHLKPEGAISGMPDQWYLRSERETLCRFSDDFLLFTINVRFAPLRDVFRYPVALADLQTSLAVFDEDEVAYFGGADKYRRLRAYLATAN